MTNRTNQLVLNIRCVAKQAAKHGFVVGAGRDMGGLIPTAVPSVGRLPMSSGSPGYQPSFMGSTEPTTTRLRVTEGNTPGVRTITGCWREAIQLDGRIRKVLNLRPKAHELTGHHDYPSHDVRHDNHLMSNLMTVANNGK